MEPSTAHSESELDTTISTGHFDHMKVSSVELKTRLGHYLRAVEQTGEPVEISVRGRLIAALLPYESARAGENATGRDAAAMNRMLEQSGLRVEPASRPTDEVEIRPLPAGDGQRDINTVEAMRQTRDW